MNERQIIRKGLATKLKRNLDKQRQLLVKSRVLAMEDLSQEEKEFTLWVLDRNIELIDLLIVLDK